SARLSCFGTSHGVVRSCQRPQAGPGRLPLTDTRLRQGSRRSRERCATAVNRGQRLVVDGGWLVQVGLSGFSASFAGTLSDSLSWWAFTAVADGDRPSSAAMASHRCFWARFCNLAISSAVQRLNV